MSFLYHPFYCEENVWHLCGNTRFKGLKKKVVFISNHGKTCAMWQMKAVKQGPIIWDYHVILLCQDDGWRVWDLDSRLACPISSKTYLEQSFREDWPETFLPLFRVVDVPVFREVFSSDRAHMIAQGRTRPEDPPAWPRIYNGRHSNLMSFIDMKDPAIPGKVMDLNAFAIFLDPNKSKNIRDD